MPDVVSVRMREPATVIGSSPLIRTLVVSHLPVHVSALPADMRKVENNAVPQRTAFLSNLLLRELRRIDSIKHELTFSFDSSDVFTGLRVSDNGRTKLRYQNFSSKGVLTFQRAPPRCQSMSRQHLRNHDVTQASGRKRNLLVYIGLAIRNIS